MNEPRTLTEAISRIQANLSQLDWTDKIYGRATIQDQNKVGDERPQLIPMAYASNGEYEDCRPNDSYKSILFFVATESEKNDYSLASPKGHAPNHILRAQRPVTLIGWANLANQPGYDDGSGFGELIKISLKNSLRSVRCVISIGNYQDGLLNEVYKPFVVSALDRKYNRWPHLAFRLELVLQYIETNP